MDASIIEARSCPMFCQCYFNTKPAAHNEHAGHSHGEGGEHFCKFNNAFKINHGHYGTTKLSGAKPIVIKNLKYWGIPRNDGFLMRPNEVEAYRGGDKPFEFKGPNGFMITIDINSKDIAKEKTGA
jgi:hypothetical protein